MFVLKTLYERAITEADRRRFAGEGNAEEALRSFWTGFVDLLVRQQYREHPTCADRLSSPSLLAENAGHRRRRAAVHLPKRSAQRSNLWSTCRPLYALPGAHLVPFELQGSKYAFRNAP